MTTRVLSISRTATLGGAERMILLGMEQSALRGYEPILACPPEGRLPDAARAKGFEVIPCNFLWMKRTLNPLALIGYASSLRRENRRLAAVCARRGIGLLHAHGEIAAMYAISAAALGIPLLLHMHDAVAPNLFRRIAFRRVESSTTRFICVSETVRAAAQRIGLAEHRTTVLYNSVDPAFLGAPPDSAVTTPGPNIALISQIVPLKGHHIFLEAAARLCEALPTARFYIVGDLAHPDDQPYKGALDEASGRPPLAGRVVFTGYVRDVPRWAVGMDVVVLTSLIPEAFGLVIAEAMALQKPVVATNIGGPTEIIEDGVTGRLVPPGEAAALAAAITEVLGNREMGARAAASVRERFSPERFGDGLARIYAEALASGRP